MRTGAVNKIIAGVIFLAMFVIYLMTAAPTISFWDCGEFVTCSYIMGIPHPPGSPLLSLLGRIMSLIPFYDLRGHGVGEIAYRVALIDVVLGALTVMLFYLVLVRLLARLRPPDGSFLTESVIMFSAAVAAFAAGFSDEFWTNSVEIETYMPGLFMSMLAVWLTLLWDERKDNPKSILYLFLAAYIIGLGNGVHLVVLLAAPTVFILVLAARPDWFASGKLWLSTAALLAGIGLVKLFGGFELLYFTMALFAFLAPFLLYKAYIRGHGETWKVVFLGILTCLSLYVIGYSVYPSVMVRAGKNPTINEGDPSNWKRYKSYMERDQYGQENMYIGMLKRKADFRYQFGFMYGRYLIQQFPKWGPVLDLTFENNRSPESRSANTLVRHRVYLSVLLLTLFLYGLYTHARLDWKRLAAFFVFFIASSIGLILYLNMENPQVRERSYFFLGSFYIIMFWLGFGIFGILTDILDWMREKGMNRTAVPICVVLFIVFGTIVRASVLSNHIDPAFTNFEVHDRTGDWAPRDYGYNILVSCEPDAVLFTNGDNDTFPLWYLQEVVGFRRNVRIVNLSLLNTDWYILQMKYEGKTLPVEFSDDYITNELCGKDERSLRARLWPVEGREITAAGITWKLPVYREGILNEKVGIIRIQDKMVANIIKWVNWSRPVYFAVTVAEENKIGLEEFLSMEGMVYRLVDTKAQPGEFLLNTAVLDNNVFEKYQYHELSDPAVYKPPNTLKLVTNYFIGFAQLAERYAFQGEKDNAVRAAWGAIKKTPNDLNKRLIIYKIFAAREMYTELKQFLDWELSSPTFTSEHNGTQDDRLSIYSLVNIAGDKSRTDSLVQAEISRANLSDMEAKYLFGTKLIQFSLDEQACAFFRNLVSENPNNPELLETLVLTLYSTGKYEEALDTVEKILASKPDDPEIKQTKELLLKLLQGQKTKESRTAQQQQ